MSISFFEVQRADDDDIWHNIGLSAHNLHDIAQVMQVYDSEGTMKLRVWDHVRDEPVHSIAACRIVPDECDRKTKTDWKQDGF